MMQLQDFLKYCDEHNIPDWALITFENPDYGNSIYVNDVNYDEVSNVIEFSH